MESTTRQKLLKQRSRLKAQLTRTETFVENFMTQPSNSHEIKLRYEDMSTLMSKFDDVQSELELGDTENELAHDQARAEFETKYYKVKGEMSKIIANFEEASRNSVDSGRTQDSSVASLKLPAINIPHFDGKYENWLSFADSFQVMIHNNSNLPSVQKFHYLASVLKGPASQLIQNLPITEANYEVAWKMLKDRFENKKLIAATHVKELLTLKSVSNETAAELLRYSNTFNSHLNALKALELKIPLHEVILTQLFAQGLDTCTRRDWELSQADTQAPLLDDLLSFVEHKRQALENFPVSQHTAPSHRQQADRNKPKSQGDTQARYTYTTTSHIKCPCCNGDHPIFKCEGFAALSVEERLRKVKEMDLCFNCLRTEHSAKQCKSRGCKLCSRKHHTSLHKSSGREGGTAHQTTSNSSHTYCNTRDPVGVLLSTSLVKVLDSRGQMHVCRALLDSGSQVNLCTEGLAQRLGLKKMRNPIPISGINDSVSQSKYSVQLQLQSTVSNFTLSMSCSVFPRITGSMPSSYIQHEHWNLPSDLKLADPKFFQPGDIELLIGAEHFFSLLKPARRTRSPDYPILQNTELGWIIAGQYHRREEKCLTLTTCFLKSEDRLDTQLQRFWEIEELTSPVMTREEKDTERHFTENTTRDATGRFIVRLPLKQKPEVLGNSFNHAMSRLTQLERRFSRQPSLKQEYCSFLREYEAMGHMVKVDTSVQSGNEGGSYYLPHHPVFKLSSSTTKTRVVFDASAKTSNNVSLNDLLMVGATIQEDLYSIILRFRMHTFAFTADIAKMYRQVLVHADDRKLQRIIWRESPKDPPCHYELTTVTYGTAAAPFLATRCLHQLAEDEELRFPRAAQVVRRDFYVDDLVSGCDDIQDALQLQSEIINLLESGGFHLRKWCANHPALLEAVSEEDRETQLPLNLDEGTSVKSLGLLWHPVTDHFLICGNLYSDNPYCADTPVTKRKVLSVIASMFDPLGLVSPLVISYKIFMQKLWLVNLNWDDRLPSHLATEWEELHFQPQAVREFHIERLVTCKGCPVDVQIHGFSDASERAYGACLYVRSVDKNGQTCVRLLCSKSRVAPVKKVTLPRLELCGALLLARLLHKTLPVLSLPVSKMYLWTDSTIVLAWIASPATRWKTFVANRVSSIQEYSHKAEWRHIPTSCNPADLISRGVAPEQLRGMNLWWHGPSWLTEPTESWPDTISSHAEEDLPESRSTAPVVMLINTNFDEFMLKYSSLSRLTRVTAYCLRFIHNSANPEIKRLGILTTQELQMALHSCIKIAQQVCYAQEIADLNTKHCISKKSKIANLNPFLDDKGLLRVGGRLVNSNLPYDTKHQLILPPQHALTILVVMAEHIRLLHAGAQLVIASLRERFWIPTAKAVVRKVTHKCLTCFRFKASTAEQLMGQLPVTRVQESRPFLNVGADYAGPFLVKRGNVRSKQTTKSYIALFICLATKALHLEVVSDLTTDAFMAALRRFTARRGKCSTIYSDNGTNFIGANRKMQDLRKLFLSTSFCEEIQNSSAMEGITWHFIPPSSPHFGGLWEAAVKSMKYHLRRVAGHALLTFEELCTLTAQIEACLNSRPLTALSNDPNDLNYLSPAHFLIGAPLTTIPEPDITDLPINRLSRWQRIQSMQQQLWKRWSADYLNSQQQRKKWTCSKENLAAGTVVLLKEDNLPPLCWKLAVVENVHPGKDGLVRVATIRTNSGAFKRPIHKLIVLPFEH